VEAVHGADLLRERDAAGAVIGMHMRVDDVRDLHALRRRELRIRIEINGQKSLAVSGSLVAGG